MSHAKFQTRHTHIHEWFPWYLKHAGKQQDPREGSRHAYSLVVAALLLPLERMCNLERKPDVAMRLVGIHVQQHVDEDAPSRLEYRGEQSV
jgi:hypothetical protein